MTAIHVQGLEKSFGKLDVLRGVDLEVARGSIFALLGSNGAGKTTLVRILATLLKADAGTAERQRLRRRHASRPTCGSRSASPGSSPPSTRSSPGGRTSCWSRGCATSTTRARSPTTCCARFSLTDAGARRVSTYSGGMRRRLDIAMSLIGDPPVIFLDEPTTGLDPEARIEVWQTVKELAGGGTTVLLTTQYLDEAEQLADRIAILHQGRIIVDGTLAELKHLLPPAEVEYVEKQPTLEDVFLAVVGDADGTRARSRPMTTHFLSDTAVLTGRSLRHVTRSLDTIITTAITPIAMMLMFVYVFGGAIDTGAVRVRGLPAARHPAHHDRLGHRLHRVPAVHRPEERDLRAVPVDADRAVGRAVGARADLAGRQPDLAGDRRRASPS